VDGTGRDGLWEQTLSGLKVTGKVIHAILWHSHVNVPLGYYVKPETGDVVV